MINEQARMIHEQRQEIQLQRDRSNFLEHELKGAEEGRREVELENANLKERLADELKKRVGIRMTK